MRRQVRLSLPAQADIAHILAESEQLFGLAARRRYDALIRTALKDIGENAERAGARHRSDFGPGIFVYPLMLSRARAQIPEGKVRRPRHVIVFRLVGHDLVDVGRVLHDSMDFIRHIPPEYRQG